MPQDAVADSIYTGLLAIASALVDVARALEQIGALRDVAEPVGAIEYMTEELKEGMESIANTIGGLYRLALEPSDRGSFPVLVRLEEGTLEALNHLSKRK